MTTQLPLASAAPRESSLRVVLDVPELSRRPEVVARPELIHAPEAKPTRGGLVQIGPFALEDLSAAQVVDVMVQGLRSSARLSRAWVAYALHVGGLNARRDKDFVTAMSRADLIYADGMSVVMLARFAGASSIERSGTTDIGWNVLRKLGDALGRPVRVALIGGPDGLTRAAAPILEEEAGVEVVLTEHGYHNEWASVLDALVLSRCDVILVGLGAPREMEWVEAHRDRLPPCLVMTCGGWFGFITRAEKRAPEWARRCGAEWAFRLAQSPRRLFRRYATGMFSTVMMALSMMRDSR